MQPEQASLLLLQRGEVFACTLPVGSMHLAWGRKEALLADNFSTRSQTKATTAAVLSFLERRDDFLDVVVYIVVCHSSKVVNVT